MAQCWIRRKQRLRRVVGDLNAVVEQKSQLPLVSLLLRVGNQAEQISIFLLQVAATQQNQSDFEAQNANLSGSLRVVDVKYPIYGEVQHQGHVDLVQRHVERMKDGRHVGNIDQLVVLGSQSVNVESFDRDRHLNLVECKSLLNRPQLHRRPVSRETNLVKVGERLH